MGLYENVGQALASRGVVCAVISYRLTALGWTSAVKLGTVAGSILSMIILSLLSFFASSPPLWACLGLWSVAILISSIVARFGFSLEGQEEVKVKDQVHDLVRALDFLREEAGTYGASSKKMVLMGHSAGGHLSLLTALSQDLGPESAEVGDSLLLCFAQCFVYLGFACFTLF